MISDADVLIDYAATDLGVLEIMATKLCPVHVTLPVLREVTSLPEEKAKRIGLLICEPTLQELTAAAKPIASLSGPDRLCLFVAAERKWACLTNDRALRRECESVGIRTIWGLEAMVHLYKAGHLIRARAVRTAQAIQAVNPHHITDDILHRFVQQLDKL